MRRDMQNSGHAWGAHRNKLVQEVIESLHSKHELPNLASCMKQVSFPEREDMRRAIHQLAKEAELTAQMIRQMNSGNDASELQDIRNLHFTHEQLFDLSMLYFDLNLRLRRSLLRESKRE